ncbi:unnamed protein product [Soboliphyme baturini]|uniref:BHLH domain-containing protein n=1 Tax=Soboliphyme baturini TaxID=241478 RepID=A0A183IVN5_9BILA|nr:unnamed protein product [Soboliphyme baturini]
MASLEGGSPLSTEQSISSPTIPDAEENTVKTGTSFDKPCSSSQYTSKDYVAASLLIEYSSQAASQYDHTEASPATSAGSNYSSDRMYSGNSFQPITSNLNSFYEPYIPQVATVSSVDSRHLQYSIAKNWNADSGMVMAQPCEASPCIDRSADAQPIECISHSGSCLAKNSSKSVNFDSSKPKKSLTMGSKSSVDKALRKRSLPETTDTKADISQGCNSSSGPLSRLCNKSRSSEDPTYCSAVSERLWCTDTRNTELEETNDLGLSTSSPVSPLYQQSAIVRPVPISLCRNDTRQFDAVSSPLFISNAHIVVQSPLQASPSSATSELTQCSYPSSPASSFLHLSQQLVSREPPFLQNSPNSSQPSLLIRPSFGGLQFPLVSYPSPMSANSSQSYTAYKHELPWNECANANADSSEIGSSQPNVKTELCPPIYSQEKATLESSDISASKRISTTKRPADSTIDSGERKRVLHLQAEQSRRSALKMGFELLEDLVCDSLSKNAKPTNALVLARAVDQIRTLKADCTSNESIISLMKAEIDKISEKIASYQSHLNASHGSAKITPFNEMVDNCFKLQLQKEWKLWPLYLLFQHLTETFNSEVNGQNVDELLTSAQEWAQKHCTRNAIRPVLSNLLVQLATDTPIFSDPQAFKLYVKKKIS